MLIPIMQGGMSENPQLQGVYIITYLLLYYIYIYIRYISFWYLDPGICVITWMGICRGSHDQGLVWDSRAKNVCNVFLGGHLHPGK